jgi:hypothetical protein
LILALTLAGVGALESALLLGHGSAAAERTRTIKPGTGVVTLPYHHPLMVANRIVLLDHLSRGRAMLGVGPGALVTDAPISVRAFDQSAFLMLWAVEIPGVSGRHPTSLTQWPDDALAERTEQAVFVMQTRGVLGTPIAARRLHHSAQPQSRC